MNNSKPKREPLPRTWFMGKGCKPVPTENGRILWGVPKDKGYFVDEYGTRKAHDWTPGMQKHPNGIAYPGMRGYKPRMCHILMALAFYGPRPTYIDKKGRKRFYECHHLINDKLNYHPDNLLCWLKPDVHDEADRRQRALAKAFPEYYTMPYARLRELQDPRIMSTEEFNRQCAEIAEKGYNKPSIEEHEKYIERYERIVSDY